MKINDNLQVFSGENSIRNFLNPKKLPYTPLVELPQELNPFYKDGVRIHAKLLNLLPLGNVKQIPAFHMLREAKKSGLLKDTHTIVEASSGNMTAALSIIGNAYGIPHTKAYVSHSINRAKTKLLRLLGAEIVAFNEPTCPDPTARGNRIELARELGKEDGYFNPSQYDNPNNPISHEEITGKQIWEQTAGNVSIVSVSLGTTGSVIGISRFLKRQNKQIITLAAASDSELKTPGIRSVRQLAEIKHMWKKWVDNITEINYRRSYESSLKLVRNGILVGPSSGLTYAGLISYLEAIKKSGQLSQLKHQSKEIHCVFICGDSPLPYLDEYFKYLDESNFPQIINEEILDSNESKIQHENLYDREPEEVYSMLQTKSTILLDVRPDEDFKHNHINGALHQDYNEILQMNSESCTVWKSKKVYVICRKGNNSRTVTNKLRQMGVQAYNIHGGMEKWFKVMHEDLP